MSEPLLTEEAKDGIDSMIHAPLDPDGRDFKNLYAIIQENNMIDLLNTDTFSSFFSSFNGLIENEKKYFKKIMFFTQYSAKITNINASKQSIRYILYNQYFHKNLLTVCTQV